MNETSAVSDRHIYDYKLDNIEAHSSHGKILNLVGESKTVLEIGCATGYMTNILKSQLKCQVYGIEINEVAALKAGPFCEKLVVGDVENLNIEEEFSNICFDVIILADVIEHLKDAKVLLEKLKGRLSDNGYILISVPNGGHGAIALEVIDGKWDYRDEGLLDTTHLHFFDKNKLTQLFDEAGYLVAILDRVIVHPRDSELKTPWDQYPREVTAYIEKVNPEYQTYQFIIQLYPTSSLGWKNGMEKALEFEKNKVTDLESQLKRIKGDFKAARAQLNGFEDELQKREKEYLIALENETKRLEEEKALAAQNYETQFHNQALSHQEHSENYQNEVNRLENEIRQIQASYQNEIERLEQERESATKNYEAEINRLTGEADGINRAYSQELQRLEQSNEEIKEDFKNTKIEFSHTKEVLQQQVHQLEFELYEIRSSNFWRLLSWYRDKKARYLSPESVQGRLYQLFLRMVLLVFTDGLGTVFNKCRYRIKSWFSKPQKDPLTNVPDSVKNQTKDPVSNVECDPEPLFAALKFPQFDKIRVSIVIPVYNQCNHTYRCLDSLIAYTKIPFEVILVDNASEDDTCKMLDQVKGVSVIRNEENLGFVKACNLGAAKGHGEFCLFLNNDTQVTHGWMEALLSTFADDKVGAVGAKLIYPTGKLQEAGNIIWQDGTGWNFGRNDDPELPPYSYVKEVDYCSGACLVIHYDLWNEIGGFDERYAPAYYEDTDLCFEVRKRGYRVMFQPNARVIHFEGASAGTDINKGYKKFQQINHAKFLEKWQQELKNAHFPGPDDLYLARERQAAEQVLVIDHYVPTYDMDSGSLRMFSLLKILKEMGYKVIFWPENRAYHDRYTRELQQIGIEVYYGFVSFRDFIKKNGKHIQTTILSRPHIATQFIYDVKKYSDSRIIYDTVDLHFLREERRAELETDPQIQKQIRAVAQEAKAQEFKMFNEADDVLVVSPIERGILEKEGIVNKVSVISNIHQLASCETGFNDREGLMFIGGFVHVPNEDGVFWFVNDIYPHIKEQLGSIPVYIVGSNPTSRLEALANDEVKVTGYIRDVAPYFERVRVFISPLRFGAGVKGKIGQSMAHGLPVVTTTIGAEGMGLKNNQHALITDDAKSFADSVVKLYEDKELWESISQNSRNHIQDNFSPTVMQGHLKKLFLNTK